MSETGIDALNLHVSDWTPELVAAMHAADRYAFAWDTQDEATLAHALVLGVDAVYSDHTARMMGAIEERC